MRKLGRQQMRCLFSLAGVPFDPWAMTYWEITPLSAKKIVWRSLEMKGLVRLRGEVYKITREGLAVVEKTTGRPPVMTDPTVPTPNRAQQAV